MEKRTWWFFEDIPQRVETRMIHGDSEADFVSSRLGMWRGAVNLALDKQERVTKGGKGTSEIGSESGKVNWWV